MAFRDLREFLDTLESKGELQRIKAEVDWNDEIAAIAEEALARNTPAFLFNNIKDHKETCGKELAINLLASWQRMALAFDMPKGTGPKELLNEFRQRIKQPIKPILLSTGPCKEVIHRGDDVNILEFPIIKIHPKDGGRYTVWQICITKDPETGWVNWGMYNSMVYDRNTVSVSPIRTQHMGIHARKYVAMGRPMPYAIAIGCEPVTKMVAAAPYKAGVNECDMAGAIRKEPVELVKCETVDLEVPATSEIVIEGNVDLDQKNHKPEGPFGRYTGYYTSLFPKDLAPGLTISCISHRKDPIYWACAAVSGPHVAPSETEYACILQWCGLLWDHLEESGIEGITWVWTDTDTIATNVFVSINKTHYGHAKQVASQIWGTQRFIMMGKFVVVVDSDIDIFNLKKVNAAIAHRTRGKRDIVFCSDHMGSPLDPGIDPDIVQKAHIGSWDRVLIDATWPFEWEAREEWGGLKHPPAALAEPHMRERAKKRWKEFGLE